MKKKNKSKKYFEGVGIANVGGGVKEKRNRLSMDEGIPSTVSNSNNQESVTKRVKKNDGHANLETLGKATDDAINQTSAAAAQSLSDIKDTTKKGLDDVGQEAKKAASETAKTVKKGLDVVDQAASDAASAVTGVAGDAFKAADQAASDAANSVNQGLKKVSNNMSNFRNLLKNRKSRLQQQQAKIKQRLAERGVPHEIADLKQRFEKSKSDVDLRNALQLENALKLHELFEELLENPIVADAIDNSSEGLNELLTAWMKLMGNAVTSAGESIPILGEFFVLENMFRRFLYNISDGSKATKKVEDAFEGPFSILGLVGEDPDSEPNANTNNNQSPPPPTQQDQERRRHIEELKKKIDDIHHELEVLNDHTPWDDGTSKEYKEKKNQDLNNELKSAEEELDEASTSPVTSQDADSAETLSPVEEATDDNLDKTKTDESIQTQTPPEAEQEASPVKSIVPPPAAESDENSKKRPRREGGAMSAMQRRINTSIEGFLQSSILNPW